MRNNYFLWCALLLSSLLQAQSLNIPDTNFKALLVANTAINTNNDGEIQLSEAQAFTGTINVTDTSNGTNLIADYTGIEAFINMTGFIAKFQNPSSIDVSKSPNLKVLDLGANTNLTSLSVAANTALEELYLPECFEVTAVNFGNNAALKKLSLRETKVATVDFSKLTGLEEVDLNSITGNLNMLDFSKNTNLVKVTARVLPITSLDFSMNDKLTHIEVDHNPELKTMNIKNGKNTIIANIYATNNPKLTSICVDNVAFANSKTDKNNGPWRVDTAVATYTANCTLSVPSEALAEKIKVYPNPVQKHLHIASELGGITIKEVRIYDIRGKELMTFTSTATIDLQNLQKGLYIAKIEVTTGGIAIKKVIKD